MKLEGQESKKLSKAALVRSWFIWAAFLHGMYNWERMQAIGVCHAMVPIIHDLYKKTEDIAAGLKRHLNFFNTNPQIGSIAAGIMASMEEQKANGSELDDETINAVKTSLMGPLAGLGDSIMQGLVFPVLLAIGISLGLQGNVAGPVLYTVLSIGVAFGLSYWCYMQGYVKGGTLVQQLTESGLVRQLSKAASFVGLLALGGLTARYVNFKLVYKIAISDISVIDLQAQVLDKIVPGLLPLLAVTGVWLLLKKGVRADRIIWGIFVIGIILGYLGILG
ncbi:MAG TPA: PTS system mannose/fructose/sorbose family transporter subunit IID [Firmicutes bacterium]|nr:PTS system mannose/fructose/sorbose family transporter subunit IID [Candidatus Fermentithermobacillaceae bacterium]